MEAFIQDTATGSWITYDSANFDFFEPCTGCGGQIKVKLPADITPYKPWKDHVVKIVATDSQGLGNVVESQFNLQLRDECTDAELT